MLTTILTQVGTYLTKVKDFIMVGLVLISISSSLIAYEFYTWNKELDRKLGIEISNRISYEDRLSSTVNSNRVLQLNISDLRHSNDSLIYKLDSVRKSLKLSENSLKQALTVETIIRDTITEYLPIQSKDSIDFTIELKPNELTTFQVSRKDSIVSVIPTILNDQYLYVTEEKKWRNKKNIIQRIFTWDWHKDLVQNYYIHNTNNLIQVVDTRVINLITK